MSRPRLTDPESSYYPPRARWHAFIFVLGDRLRHRMAVDDMSLPYGVKISEIVSSFFVPGLGVWLRGPKYWGVTALAYCWILAMIFVVWLGYPAANWAFGMLISAHVTGFVYYCSPLLNTESFAYRIRFTFLTMLALSLLLYWPARTLILGHWVTPLRLHGRVMVVGLRAEPKSIQRGDWVAYTLPDTEQGPHGDVVVVHHGVGLGPVLAVAGDQIRFDTNSFSVNGVSQTNLWRMPTHGGLTVPDNCWFIWPDLGITEHGRVRQTSIDSALLQMASVDKTQFYGRPPRHWFWRKQF
jgi:hypothetical protein